MVQVVEMTDEEKMTMYMKLSKKEIITMLIQCNKEIDMLCNVMPMYVTTEIDMDKCSNYFPNINSTGMECINCGKSKIEH